MIQNRLFHEDLAAYRRSMGAINNASFCHRRREAKLLRALTPSQAADCGLCGALSQPDDVFRGKLARQIVSEVLQELHPQEERILRMHYGFDTPVMTVREIGEAFGLCRARIYQIKAKALRKLRHPVRVGRLRLADRSVGA